MEPSCIGISRTGSAFRATGRRADELRRVLAVLAVSASITASQAVTSAGASPNGALCGWSTLVPQQDTTGRAAPRGRLAHSAIVDGPRARLVIFAGDTQVDSVALRTQNDVWSLSLDASPAWTELLPTGTAPPDRRGHTALFDSPRNRMIVFGGIGFDSLRQPFWPDDSLTVWSLSLNGDPQWSTPETGSSPYSRRHSHAAALDPVRQDIWVYGGAVQFGGLNFSSELFLLQPKFLPGDAWVGVVTMGPNPPGLAAHVLVHDPARDRLLLFGGIQAGTAAPMRDVWQLTLEGVATWSKLAVDGTPPEETTDIRAVYDPVGDQMIVVGPSGVHALALSGTPTWRSVTPHDPRYGVAVAYDGAGSRILAMGGESGAGVMLNDVLALTPPPTVSWSVDPASTGSVAVEYHGSCPDSATLTAIPSEGFEFAEWSGDATGSENPITIALDAQKNVVAGFQKLTATLISRFDAVRTALGVELRWGFGDPARVASTTIERRAAGASAWQSIVLAVRSEHGAEVALDSGVDAALEYEYRLRVVLDSGEEILVGPVRAAAAGQPLATAIESASPNPSPGAVTISFTLARGGPATLTVLDVAGREVTRLVSGEQEPGRYQASWDGAAAGRRLPPGIYFARLDAPGAAIVRKLVLAR